jgi:hypothetical protein
VLKGWRKSDVFPTVRLSLILNNCWHTLCELSLDPEVATLFGIEIGQSNGDILLTICDDSKDKSRPVTCIAKC